VAGLNEVAGLVHVPYLHIQFHCYFSCVLFVINLYLERTAKGFVTAVMRGGGLSGDHPRI